MSIKTCYIIGCNTNELPFENDESSESFHRFDKFLYQKIVSLCILGFTRFYTGLNNWVEIWSAENVIRLSNFCSEIELCVILKDCYNIGRKGEAQQRLEHILENADSVAGTYNNALKSIYNIDACLVIYDPRNVDSSIRALIDDAQKMSKEIFTINPWDF